MSGEPLPVTSALLFYFYKAQYEFTNCLTQIQELDRACP